MYRIYYYITRSSSAAIQCVNIKTKVGRGKVIKNILQDNNNTIVLLFKLDVMLLMTDSLATGVQGVRMFKVYYCTPTSGCIHAVLCTSKLERDMVVISYNYLGLLILMNRLDVILMTDVVE